MENDFVKWLKDVFRDIKYVTPFVSAVGSIAFTVFSYFLDSWNEAWFKPAILAFHLSVCLALLCLIPSPASDFKQSSRVAKAVDQFHEAWRMLWFSWSLLYLFITLQSLTPFVSGTNFDDPWWNVPLNLFNNLQTISLFMCYIVITKSTVDEKRADSPLPWLPFLAMLAVVTTLEISSIIAIENLKIMTSKFHSSVFCWIGGILAGVSFALVIGRLDSKFIDPPTPVIFFLYLYAVIQPTWIAFLGDEEMQAILFSVALVLKCLLFVFISWLFQSGTLFFYIDKMLDLYEHAADQRRIYISKILSIKTGRREET